LNFLELCKATALDAGTIAGLPSFTTVVDPVGRVAQLVAWVRDAWIDIQNERRDWLFMQSYLTKALTIDENAYEPESSWGITDFGSFLPETDAEHNLSIYDPAIGKRDESYLRQISYSEYRRTYDIGVHDAQRPSVWAFGPFNQIWFGPTPDKAYTVRGMYRRSPQVLALDDDVPIMPAAYHRLIQGEAIRLMARSDEAFQVVVEKTEVYMRLRGPLVRDQTGSISFAEDTLA
jgi:hypothetical protein